jgi:uncharacterized membrane protein
MRMLIANRPRPPPESEGTVLDYFHIILFLHILGAIAGFGPTFAYGFMTPLKNDERSVRTTVETIQRIQRRLVLPVIVIQPITGVLLIGASGRDQGFWQHEWLWIAISIYAVLFVLAIFVDAPSRRRSLEMVRADRIGTPEFDREVKLQNTLGPILGVGVLVILILMVFKPGD